MGGKRRRNPACSTNKAAVSSEENTTLEDKVGKVGRKARGQKKDGIAVEKHSPSSKTGDPPSVMEANENEKNTRENSADQPNKRKLPMNEAVPSPSKRQCDPVDSDDDAESDGVEWEDVEEAEIKEVTQESLGMLAIGSAETAPSETKSVEISIKVPGKKAKGERTKEAIKKYIQRVMNRFRKDVQEGMHKVHIMALIAHGFHQNNLCNDCFVQAWSLSLVPLDMFSVPPKKWDVAQLDKLLRWFLDSFPGAQELITKSNVLATKMEKVSMSEIFVSLLRAVGFLARLVLSLQPVPLKAGTEKNSPKAGDQTQNEAKKVPTQPRKPKPATSQNAKHPNPDGRGRKDMTSVDKSKRRVKLGDEQGPSGISEKELKDLAAESPNENVKKRRRSDKMQGREMKTPKAENESSGKRENLRKRRKVNYSDSVAVKNEKNGESSESERVENAESSSGNGGETRREGSGKKRPSRTPKTRNFRKQSLCSDSPDTDSDFEEGSHRRDLRSQKAAASVNHRLSKPQAVDKSGTSKTPQRKRSVGAKQAKQTPIRESVHPEGSGSDSDFVETTTPVPRRCGPSASSAGTSLENSKGSFSKNTTRGIDTWAEVYLPREKNWICLHLESSSVNHPELCESHSTRPLLYVVAFDSDGCVKDVTSRYASNWMAKNRKMRVDENWLIETLLPYKAKNKRLDKAEDAHLQAQQLEKPLPTSITEYKNHPLYVLKRHLLKFEAIYPESAAILGFCRNEPVYSRDCVHLLHTREKWLNEALVVKEGEKAYKIVKGRPKRNQPVQDPNSVKIELFGRWQTEKYKPPPAKNGKVPRNEYGNVELFQMSMLPPGTSYIQIPGIQRVARKLGIDCAPAVVGFDFHCGFSHPVIEGVVVCEEFEDTLRDAWRQEEEETKRKKEEKRQKRVLGNWKLLVRTLLIREKLKRRYNTEESKPTPDADEDVEDLTSVAWPLNVQGSKTTINKDGHCHVFPEEGFKQDPVTGEWTKACTCGLRLPFEKM